MFGMNLNAEAPRLDAQERRFQRALVGNLVRFIKTAGGAEVFYKTINNN
jgi:hypothetical protein